MRNFSYARAQAQADLPAERQKGSTPLSGGTELLNCMRLGITEPSTLLDISRLGSLRGICMDSDTLVIGATTTLADIAASDQVQTQAPALAIACSKTASPQIRNRATLGGSLMQRTRCLYFRAEAPVNQAFPWPCNKRVEGSGCSALDGSEPRAALFGASEKCVASYPSDAAIALAALDARVLLLGSAGERTLPAADFTLTPADADREGYDPLATENRLAADEIILGYRIPLGPASTHSNYIKVRQRESYEHALISAAIACELDGDEILTLRIALGAVAMKPWRLKEAEASLIGKRLTVDHVKQALAGEFTTAVPMPGQDYKIRLASNAVIRAIFGEAADHD